jgi:hypothetical protein
MVHVSIDGRLPCSGGATQDANLDEEYDPGSDVGGRGAERGGSEGGRDGRGWMAPCAVCDLEGRGGCASMGERAQCGSWTRRLRLADVRAGRAAIGPARKRLWPHRRPHAGWMWASKWEGTPAHRVAPGSRAPDCEGGGADEVEECGPQVTRYLMGSVSLRLGQECVKTERTCALVRGANVPGADRLDIACTKTGKRIRSLRLRHRKSRRGAVQQAARASEGGGGLKHIRSEVALDESAGYTSADAACFAERESPGPD